MINKLSKEEIFLSNKDLKLKKIIKKNGHLNLQIKNKDPFNELVEIIVSQFISTSSANTISKNMKKIFGSKKFNKHNFSNLRLSQIKNLGLSHNKAKAIKNLVTFFEANGDEYLFNIEKKRRENELLSIFGIGPWSVDMFEIFCLGNLDIFSPGDAALREAMRKANMIGDNVDPSKYSDYASRWSPYRSIASIHLWKTVD